MEPCVVAAAPDDGDHTGAAPPPPTGGLKRKRYAFGSTDEFEEITRLGEGAFGAVFMARHSKTGRTVAIKRLAPGPGGRAAVLREASFLQASGRDNPFVVRLLGVASRPGTGELCLVMECGGQSIRDLLRRRRPESPPLPEKTVCAVMWQLLTAAKKVHDRRIVHRDIKPGNILLSDERRVVKICDFGVAMHKAARPPYASAGTRCYMAPEMLLKKRDYNALVDTWSLGCVMAELVNGRKLFQGVAADDDTHQLCAIFDVLGVPDEKTWPWFASTRFATDVYMDAGSVARIMCRRGGLGIPEPALAEVAAHCVMGLAQLHSRGVAHLDVKPENLLANSRGEIKISDFNTSKILYGGAGERLQVSLASGTSAYFSPERFAPRARAGPQGAMAADVWGLGYEETCCLGEGSYGAVIKARHRATGQVVAIKHVSPVLGGPMAVLREAAFLDACSRDNPFVVGFHGIASRPGTKDISSLVMECGGQSLGDILLQLQAGAAGVRALALPDEATVCAIMWQLLTGVKKMHARHIIHRDIKPGNIVVSNDHKFVKICDFGLAVHMVAEPPPYEVAGTLRYMAPEMVLEKPDYDALVDTWSLGCVMAELISGRRLFDGDNDEDQLCGIFDLLGAPDETTWPWFSSTDFAANVMPELCLHRQNFLRMQFPETKLSNEGFQVLSGLLTCNPDKRLTAAAALKKPCC
ncbi:hypothetical protein U9M48_010161 [Paspalum notatum var. saurae]|uniref:[RNA-polymerase]-subunit kinase n=1 Tax=Paspalum notatum var. saurae TaxID=547442 RepID=A0AAQ3SSQ7_PASNO